MARDDDFESHRSLESEDERREIGKKKGRKEGMARKKEGGENETAMFRGWRLSFKSVGNYSASATWTRFGPRKWPRMNILSVAIARVAAG